MQVCGGWALITSFALVTQLIGHKKYGLHTYVHIWPNIYYVYIYIIYHTYTYVHIFMRLFIYTCLEACSGDLILYMYIKSLSFPHFMDTHTHHWLVQQYIFDRKICPPIWFPCNAGRFAFKAFQMSSKITSTTKQQQHNT